jgi:2-polyprenyl-6-hydroxyphenyl methylase/3-demethylubiquinone-9 3-methyltransferase
MPVDNDLYNREAHTWWDEESFLSILRSAVNPARLDYMDAVLHMPQEKSQEMRALDVGCGGGYLTQELAGRGFKTTGIDPASASLARAASHSSQAGLAIDYRVARAESLPFPDGTFDLVTCCDVLEHVDDLERVVAEIARVLKPGGVFLYDTINRTCMTWLGVIFTAQEFPLTRFFPPDTHDWRMFIRPEELEQAFGRHGLVNQEVRGLSAPLSPLGQFWLILQLKYGGLTYREYGRRTRLHLSNDSNMNYIGYAIKS